MNWDVALYMPTARSRFGVWVRRETVQPVARPPRDNPSNLATRTQRKIPSRQIPSHPTNPIAWFDWLATGRPAAVR